MASVDCEAIGCGGVRQSSQTISDKREFIRVAALCCRRDKVIEGARRHWKQMVVVLDDEARTFARENDFSFLKDPAVMIAQHRKQKQVAQLCFRRIPFDIKVSCVAAGRTILKHVPPPRILST